jgi:hypothetical protein
VSRTQGIPRYCLQLLFPVSQQAFSERLASNIVRRTLKYDHLLRTLPTLALVVSTPHWWSGFGDLLVANGASDLALEALHIPRYRVNIMAA